MTIVVMVFVVIIKYAASEKLSVNDKRNTARSEVVEAWSDARRLRVSSGPAQANTRSPQPHSPRLQCADNAGWVTVVLLTKTSKGGKFAWYYFYCKCYWCSK